MSSEMKGDKPKDVTDLAGEQEEEEFSVEKVLDTTSNQGKVEHHLKSEGCSGNDNTLKPKGKHDLIEGCEEDRKAREASNEMPTTEQIQRPSSSSETTERKPNYGDKEQPTEKTKKPYEMREFCVINSDANEPRGFDRGLEPEEILGASDHRGPLVYMMKWKGSNVADIVPAELANVRCPQTVIRFYEKHLKRALSTDNNADNS